MRSFKCKLYPNFGSKLQRNKMENLKFFILKNSSQLIGRTIICSQKLISTRSSNLIKLELFDASPNYLIDKIPKAWFN
ncbi:hypothetical protein BpHYR1_021667 [Brachionus plicatilis]|uniref:Uncharacterized protein n=1 Tax=Brachionus plicatilis TaxID=10195 RepID=A0A3M7RUM5_BRAPC|nr:hypothetical protein BpHYR1_021667 [Brachionus plicatilis]